MKHIDDEASDAELITRYRAGDDTAASVLFTRHHEPAVRFATRLAGRSFADDLAAEAFSQVLSALRNGRGPDVAFRAYLITSIRNTHINSSKRDGRLTWVEDHESTSLTAAADETALRSESTLLAQAFATLPERWQTVLWHTNVEDDSTADVGRLLGISPSAVAALAYRAREGLRQAYLSAHVAATDDPSCREVRESLPAHSRGRLGTLESQRIERHLDDCAACAAVLADLRGITSDLPALLIPALLGSAGVAIHGSRPRKKSRKSKQQEVLGRNVGKDGGRVGSGGQAGLARGALSRMGPARSIAAVVAVAACVVAIVVANEADAPDNNPVSASGLGGGEVLTLIEPPAPVPNPTDKVEPAPDAPFIELPALAQRPKPPPASEPEPEGTTYDLVLNLTNIEDLGDEVGFDLEAKSPGVASTLVVNISDGTWGYDAWPDGSDCSASTEATISCVLTAGFDDTFHLVLLGTGGTKAFTASLTAADNTDPTPGDATVSFSSP